MILEVYLHYITVSSDHCKYLDVSEQYVACPHWKRIMGILSVANAELPRYHNKNARLSHLPNTNSQIHVLPMQLYPRRHVQSPPSWRLKNAQFIWAYTHTILLKRCSDCYTYTYKLIHCCLLQLYTCCAITICIL